MIAGRTHEQSRHGFVAATDQHDRIHRLGADHLFGVDGHLITQKHAGRVGKRFVQRDNRKIDGQAAGQHDTALHRLDQLRNIAMAGVVAAEGIGNTDYWPFQRIVRIAHGLDEGLAQEDGKSGIAIGR
jgi:hypothetical protein